jgi:hypothetical protein
VGKWFSVVPNRVTRLAGEYIHLYDRTFHAAAAAATIIANEHCE